MSAAPLATFDLSGQTALVTGGASGIGHAIATALGGAGARLILVDRSPAVHDAAAAFGPQHLAFVADVAAPEEVTRVCQEALTKAGRIDILVNNAGIAAIAPAAELSVEAWDTTMLVNLRAPFLFAQAVGPSMCRQGYGRIVHMASQAANIALDKHAAYTASKAGLIGLSKVLALEWGPFGVTSNTVSPTVVETALGKKAWAGEVGEAFKRKIPAGRFAQPEEVANAVLFLASPAAAMINGDNLVIDGGFSVT